MKTTNVDAMSEIEKILTATESGTTAVSTVTETILTPEQKKELRDKKFAKLSPTGQKLFLIREEEQELKLKNKAEKEQLLKTLKEEKEAKVTTGNNAGGENSRTAIIGRLFREQPGMTKSWYLTESDKLFSETHGVELNPNSALTYFSLAYPIVSVYDPTFTIAPEPAV